MQNNISSKFQSLAKEEKNYLGKLAFQKMSVEYYMNDCEDGHPAVYVGTYAKYNDGSLFGMWVDLVKCGDYDTFMEVCHNLHADEEDPELMYQDYECFPSAWYSESGIDEDTFDKIRIMNVSPVPGTLKAVSMRIHLIKSWNMPIWMRMIGMPTKSLLIASAMIALTASRSATWVSGIQKRISLSTSLMSATISMTWGIWHHTSITMHMRGISS